MVTEIQGMIRTEKENRYPKEPPSILFVLPEAFHNGWMGSTRRLFHFAGAFRELGFNVGLLAGKMTNPEIQSIIDRQFPGLVFRSEHTGSYPRAIDVSARHRRAWRGLWKLRGADYYAARLSYGWGSALDVDSVIKQFGDKSFSPDLLWGMCGGYLAGGVAADRLAKRLRLPWILDMHDPPRGCGLDHERIVICAEYRQLLRSASRIVVLSDSYQRRLVGHFHLDPQNVEVIHICFEDKLQNKGESEWISPWNIVYAGSLSEGRSLNPLVCGFSAALNRQPLMAATSFIYIAGEGSSIVETRKLAEGIGIINNIRILGLIPKDKVYELVQSAGVLVAVQTESRSLFEVPGKIYEYMSYGKPIIGIMPPKCEAASILRRSGLGFVHSESDIDGIADTLFRLWIDWSAKRTSVERDHDYISQFSASSLPDRLRSILRGVV